MPVEYSDTDLERNKQLSNIPVVAMRDAIVFPNTLYPILAGRPRSIKALNKAYNSDGYLLLCAQRQVDTEEPEWKDLYEVGTLARITQFLKLPNNLIKVLVQGITPGQVNRNYSTSEMLSADVGVLAPDESSEQVEQLVRKARQKFEQFVMMNSNLPEELLLGHDKQESPSDLLYFIASYLELTLAEKQKLLEVDDLQQAYETVIKQISQQIQLFSISNEIDQKVQNEMKEHQRKFYIQQQINALQDELDENDFGDPKLVRFKEKAEQLNLPEYVRSKANDELERLKKTPSMSPEYSVGLNYLDWLISLPWGTFTKDQLNISEVQQALEREHYGLDRPKERILEYIAVLNLVEHMKGQILCFAGPPGSGKTSLANSIAKAMGRNYTRIALGGIRDEAEIRGHRRTYIGSMPGRIVQSIQKAGSMNPVIILDEIDKVGHDHRGDPSSAILEVLDPEQNYAFMDHYLDIEFDLSQVLFITTANVVGDIQPALRDRMEIINLPGYLEPEKVQIAKRHLIPRQVEAHGLNKIKVKFKDEALENIIRSYTRESGVRMLEQQISKLCRKIARQAVSRQYNGKKMSQVTINNQKLESYLGVPRFRDRQVNQKPKVGSVNGLAWTQYGGSILQIDVARMPGKNKFELTGQMGDVMKESARAALSYIRARSSYFGLPDDYFDKHELHIHLPEGAIPKDGPSAGLPMLLAMISLLTGYPGRRDVASTGEITLRGEVLAIGGLNEKLMAAQRHHLSKVLIPKENHPDLTEVPEAVKKGLKIVEVEKIEDAIPHILHNFPQANLV